MLGTVDCPDGPVVRLDQGLREEAESKGIRERCSARRRMGDAGRKVGYQGKARR